MTKTRLLPQVQFSAILLAPFLLSFFLLAVFYGCGKTEQKAAATPELVSVENMQIAYGKALKFVHMYRDFEAQAVKERYPLIAQRYRAIARSEEIHAAAHADWLKGRSIEPRAPQMDSVVVGKTLQTLKMSESMEEIETSSMYPNLIRTADAEKLPELSAQLALVKEADVRHTAIFKEILDNSGRIAKTPLAVCTTCGYILTGKATECPNCHAPSAKLETVL
jgi:rubrerythrin